MDADAHQKLTPGKRYRVFVHAVRAELTALCLPSKDRWGCCEVRVELPGHSLHDQVLREGDYVAVSEVAEEGQ